MKKIKILLIAALISINAHADVFDDIGEFINNNKTVTAIVGIGALSAAAASIKPISMLLRTSGKEIASTEELAGATQTDNVIAGLEKIPTNSFESIASKLEVGENEVILADGEPLTIAQSEALEDARIAAERENLKLEKAERKADVSLKRARSMPITRKSLLEIRAAKQAELAERQAKLALQVEKVNKDLKVATKQVEVAAREAIEDDRKASILLDDEGRSVADRLDAMDGSPPMKGQTFENTGVHPELKNTKELKTPLSQEMTSEEAKLQALRALVQTVSLGLG